MKATYAGNGSQVFLIELEFDNRVQADEFFTDWSGVVSEGVQVTHFETNLPGIPIQDRVLRTYNAMTGRAYSAW